MIEADTESPSVLSLVGRVSAAAYVLVLLVGLATLVLVIQRPVASTDDLTRAMYSDACAKAIVNARGEAVKKLFTGASPEISWPFDVHTGVYCASVDDSTRAKALGRYLNERSTERERHLLILMRDKTADQLLREFVERDMAAAGTVTVPILQSRIASGDFAISLALLFIFIHIYVMYHREHLQLTLRARNRSLHVMPSLFAANVEDLERFSARKRACLIWGQAVLFFGLPFVLSLMYICHLYRVDGSWSTHTRIFCGLVFLIFDGIVVFIGWFKWTQEPVVTLFSRNKQGDKPSTQ